MCEVLDRVEARGIKKGMEKGIVKGAITIYHDELGLTEEEIAGKIMLKFGYTREEAEKNIKEVLSSMSA